MIRRSRGAKDGPSSRGPTSARPSSSKSASVLDRRGSSSGSWLPVLAVVLLIVFLHSLVENHLPDDEPRTSAHVRSPRNDQHLDHAAPSVDAAPLLDADGTLLHVIFSTDCSEFQHWQSYLLFHSAMTVRQPGRVTRIASGCSDEQRETVNAWHEEHVRRVMSDRFTVHFTPRFSSVKREDGSVKGDYKFFNKPFGLRHWMEHAEDGPGFDETTGEPLDRDRVVVLVDPDMILLRPITADFSNDRDTIVRDNDAVRFPRRVSHGHPVAQKYGLGAQWRTFDLATITGASDSPAIAVSQREAQQHYPAGPPYLATAADMYKIAVAWTEFAPRLHAEYPHLLAEMYAYCVAAAHAGLPHLMVESLMVSNTEAGGEGWPLVDAVEGSVCGKLLRAETEDDGYARPSVVHYCQRYVVGDAGFFAKRRMPQRPRRTGFFECESPQLAVPPDDLGEAYPYKLAGRSGGKENLKPKIARREAFMVCAITKALNDAGAFFKKNHCDGNGNMSNDLQLTFPS